MDLQILVPVNHMVWVINSAIDNMKEFVNFYRTKVIYCIVSIIRLLYYGNKHTILRGDNCKVDLNKGQVTVPITRYRNGVVIPTDDILVVEEPLEIFLDGNPYYLTMRMPGNEMLLAIGYCFSEGIIDSIDDVLLVHYCREKAGNRIEITLDPKRRAAKGLEIKAKRLMTYSSCGICGKEIVEDLCTRLRPRDDSVSISAFQIDEMMGIVEKCQQIFAQTGGAHAAGIFNKDCQLLAFAEDVGRHNALDKAMGRLVFDDKMGEAVVVVVTSRLSYEMVQKTGRSGAQILIGMSSATSLAVELAKSINLTLIGFAKKGCGNVYTAAARIAL